jgi:hypothetical protein
MLFQRVNRDDPEKVFIVVKNSYTVALSNGQAVIWDIVTEKDGVAVERPTAIATNLGIAAAGIVVEAIGINDYGLIQVYGYHSAVKVRVATSEELIVPGTALALAAAGSVFCLESFLSDSNSINPVRYPCAFSLGTYSSWTTTTIAALVKAL